MENMATSRGRCPVRNADRASLEAARANVSVGGDLN